MESTIREYNSPQKQNLGFFVTNAWQHLPHLLLEVRDVNNRRFTKFFDRYFHIPLPIVTKHKLGLPFPPKNLPTKFGTNPSNLFSYRGHRQTDTQTHTQTDRQTHKPTLVKTYSLAFAWRTIVHVIKMLPPSCSDIMYALLQWLHISRNIKQ